MMIRRTEGDRATPDLRSAPATSQTDARQFEAQLSAARPAASTMTIPRKPVPTAGGQAGGGFGTGDAPAAPQHLLDVAQGNAGTASTAVKPPKSSPLSAAQLGLRDNAMDMLQKNHGYMRKAESQIKQGEAGGAKGFFQKHIWHTNRFPTDINSAKSSEQAVKGHLAELDVLARNDKLDPAEKQDKLKAKSAELASAVQDYSSKLSGAKKEDKNSRANDLLKWGITSGTSPVTRLIP